MRKDNLKLELVVSLAGIQYRFDLQEPIDLSLPHQIELSRAFSLSPPSLEPIASGDFVGSVSAGGPCNCSELRITPHGSGTHTEGAGHVISASTSITASSLDSFFLAHLISVSPADIAGDQVITRALLDGALKTLTATSGQISGLIIRTLPNSDLKKSKIYSGTNPPYLAVEAAELLSKVGVRHLLIDLPSVDKEQDEGKLLAHRAFFGIEADEIVCLMRKGATITELIFVPELVDDGLYLVNLQIAQLPGDAVPSRVLVFPVILGG